MQADLTGKIVLVTGGTEGVGKAIVQKVSEWNAARVIVACRNEQKGNALVAEIKEKTNRENVEIWQMDLADLASVRAFIKRLKESGMERLDLLINNAGVFQNSLVKTKDGFEMMFQVNFLSHFLLTNSLFDELKASPTGARIVHVTSNAAFSAKLDFDNLNGEKGFSLLSSYPNSKLLQVIYSCELNRRLEGTGVTSYSVDPGFIRSGLASQLNPLLQPIRNLIMFFANPPEVGATSVLYAAVPETAPTGTLHGGTHQFNGRDAGMPLQAKDEEIGKRLWDVAEELLKSTESEQ